MLKMLIRENIKTKTNRFEMKKLDLKPFILAQ